MNYINISVAAVAIAFFAICCAPNAPQSEEQHINEPKEAAAVGEPSKLRLEPIDQAPANVQLPGEFQYATRFRKEGMTNLVLFSLEEAGDYASPGWSSILHVSFCREEGGQYEVLHSVQHKQEDNYSSLNLLDGRTQLVELDNIGTFVMYSFADCPDSEDPCLLTANLINQGGKYSFSRDSDQSRGEPADVASRSLDAIPAAVQEVLEEEAFAIQLENH